MQITPLEELSEATIEAYTDTVLRDEKEATIHAFRMYRQAKQENNIDIGEGRSAQKLIRSAHVPLSGYEEAARSLKQHHQELRNNKPQQTQSS